MNNNRIQIEPLHGVNGLRFGAPFSEVCERLGQPDEALYNYTGEYEARFGDSFYRFYEGQLVECTFPDTYGFIIDGIEVLSVLEWLNGCTDVVDKAKFRISRQLGIAYDYRRADAGSVTVFAAGHWDALLSQAHTV